MRRLKWEQSLGDDGEERKWKLEKHCKVHDGGDKRKDEIGTKLMMAGKKERWNWNKSWWWWGEKDEMEKKVDLDEERR